MMQQIIHQNLNRNGNGNGSIGGRGILRRKLSHKQRTGLATDVALGLVPVELSMKQAAAAVGVRPDEIRAELKARAARGKVEEQERESAERAGAIVGAWVRASDEERAKAIQAIGICDVWNVLANVVG